MVTALDRKLIRSLWRMRGQVLAIALVIAAAAATFVLSTGVHGSLTATRDAYYARNGFGNVFAGMTRAPRSMVAQVAQIPGVQRAEGSIIQYATLDMPGRDEPVRALLNSVREDRPTAINRITLRKGRLPERANPGEVVVDEAFAAANGLSLGDEVNALIYGVRQRLTVVGIGLAPNYIYALAPGELLPDNRRFGVFWMGEKALEAATDRIDAINSLTVTLQRGASEADVIRRIDRLLAPFGGTGAYGRADHLSNAFLDNELMQLEAMTRVIPPVFLLVAVFLVYIVLGRMIRIERSQIGLLKAFGYSDLAIGWHYLKFALAIAVLGCALGLAAGAWMGRAMTGLYAEYYRFPFLAYQISPQVFAGALALSLGTAALGAIAGMRSAVRLSPAVAMTAPPPPVYRTGTVARIGRAMGLSATGHMIVRHIARWPGRSAVTVLGVAMSAGLLFSTMQFIDSSRAMIDTFFLRAQVQNLTVSFVEPRNRDVVRALQQIPGVLRVETTRGLAVRLTNGVRSKRSAIESASAGAQLVSRIDSEGNRVELPPGGLMLSRQLADQLRLRVGDRVQVEMLGGRQTRTEMRVANIIDDFIGSRAYMNETALDLLARDASPVGSALLKVDPAAQQAIVARLKDMPIVLGVSERDASVRLFEKMIEDNLFTMLFFYIAFASAIAVGVVYNSARILFAERAHELATLRVLGYYRSEVAVVLVGELALLIVAAMVPGCLIGYFLAQLMTEMFSSDLFRLPFAPSRSSYGWSVVIVLAAATVTALLAARRVSRLDMVAVLKARD
jgi:putative ABC transport system permease protein